MATSEQKKSFSAYDFEHDSKWLQYEQNLEIPMGRNRDDVLFKYKQKYYKANVDPEFVISGPSSSSTSSAVPSRAPGPTPRPTARPPPGAPSASTPAPAPAAAPSRLGGLHVDYPTLLFLANAWVSVMAVIAFFPLMPPTLSRRAYKLALWGALGTSVSSLYLQAGLPRGWSLAGVQAWLAASLATVPFLTALFCFVFLTSPTPLTMAVVPIALPAILQSAGHLKSNFGQAEMYRRYLSSACTWLEQHGAQAQLLRANAEIGIGFSLIFQLITPQRNFFQLFVYWNLLKILYHAPPTSYSHRASWAAIQQRTQPILQMVPTLNTPLSYIQNWFQRV